MKKLICLLLLLPGIAFANAEAEQKDSSWQVGVGTTVVYLADYRGSQRETSNGFVFPYFYYESKRLSINEKGLTGRLFDGEKLKLRFSGSAALTFNTEDNPLRTGMPEIDPAFGLGPALEYNMTGSSFDDGWSAYFPVRAIYTFDFDDEEIEHIGWVAHPQFLYRKPEIMPHWKLLLSLGAQYANRDIHDYYYSVAPQFATATRPAYSADKGYSGFVARISLSRRKEKKWLSTYLRYDNLSSAAFVDSPLVETDHYVAFGVAMGWDFFLR